MNLPQGAGHKTQRLVGYLAFVLIGAMVIVSTLLVLSLPKQPGTSRGSAGLVAFCVFGTAAAVGVATGFLFGLPRARVADKARSESEASGIGLTSTYYLTNSNLIKVSDWLTTIIIGLGLVNLRQIAPAFRRLGAALKAPLGGMPYSATIGVNAAVGGAVAGFLLTYLWTSVRVREILEESERQSERGVVPNLVNRTIAEAKEDLAVTSLRLVRPEGVADDALITQQAALPGTIVPRGSEVRVTA